DAPTGVRCRGRHDLQLLTAMSTMRTQALDTKELEQRVKGMYQEVSRDPHGEFHFETGRTLAERLGYSPADLDRIPAPAIDSFAGVGHFLQLAGIEAGEPSFVPRT